jgi:hypothetical protein
MLVDAGADVDAVDNKGFTPLMREIAKGIHHTLHTAHQSRHERVAELLDLGADPMRKTPDGRNLLKLYIGHMYPPTVKLLLDAGVNPMETDSAGEHSTLYYAVYGYGKNDDEAREMIIAAAKELDILAAQEIIRKAKWDKTAKHIAKEVSWFLPIIISLAYMGFSIAARQKIYRNRPQSNWVITVNAFTAGFIGGIIVILLPFFILGVTDNIIQGIGLIAALIVGVITGVVLATKFSRETYSKKFYLYYNLSALTAALPLWVSAIFLNS